MPITIPDSGSDPTQSSGFLGAGADVSVKTLEPANRVITSVENGITVCDSLVYAWQKGIHNAARITAKINGERPYGKQMLKSKGKGHKRNISTRFLAQMVAKIEPRFFMPVRQASTLTSATLPAVWPDGPVKTEKFGRRLTNTIRAWPKWDYFIEGFAHEITSFGVGYAVWFDKYEWKPTLIRMDKGFCPQGTEIMDDDLQFFCVKWQYHPNDLLKLLKASVDAGRKEWQRKACVDAINKAAPPPVGPTFDKWRDYEDLIRQSVWSIAYYKAMRLIDTYHLFVREHTGKVSHYVYWRDGTKTGEDNDEDNRLLYSSEDEYDSISEVCVPVVFGYGDGSIQGSWGAGQLLFDMAGQVEIARNDAMDAQAASSKMKLQASEGKNINDIKMTINDDMMAVEGAQFAQPGAALPTNSQGYKMLDDEFTMWAMQLVGNYIPPISLQPSDTKAAAINAASGEQQEVQMKNLENFLKHIARIIRPMGKRLSDPTNPYDDSKEFRKGLLTDDSLTEEEINKLVNQPVIKTITEFTPAAAQARAQFAQSRLMGPSSSLYDPRKLEEIQAQGVPGGKAVVDYAMVKVQDGTNAAGENRQQTLENTTLRTGVDPGVLAQDNDWVHMQNLKPGLQAATARGDPTQIEALQAGLKHYAAHYSAGVAKKGIPPDQVNPEKSWIAELEKAIQTHMIRHQATLLTQQAGAPPIPQNPGAMLGAPEQTPPAPVATGPDQTQVPPALPPGQAPKVVHNVKIKTDPTTGRVTEQSATQTRQG